MTTEKYKTDGADAMVNALRQIANELAELNRNLEDMKAKGLHCLTQAP
jgi:phage terminase large subunit-like protein